VTPVLTLHPFRLVLLVLPSAAGVSFGEDEGQQVGVYPEPPEGNPPPLEIEGASASSAEKMRPYLERLEETDVSFRMLPIPGGTFLMGSPGEEPDRDKDEGPQHEVRVDPFWMEAHEVTWDEYQVFQFKLDIQLRSQEGHTIAPQAPWADAVSRPTPPYVPMDFSMGVEGYPAICMTQFAAKQYTKWLSMKTGRFYRLPTEAEWEYACRAGTTTAYSWGDDPADVDDHAWYYDNADDGYRQVGKKKANPWGLFDMHGNVAEWVLDGHQKNYGLQVEGIVDNPIHWPRSLYPRLVRGGSWDDDIEELRSAGRRKSLKSWKVQDPQLPKSIWYHTDAQFVGFRVVRPLKEPSKEEQARYWEADLHEIRVIQEKQRQGGR
jgi:formylglycine-generating enzyme required for sulfatase activity